MWQLSSWLSPAFAYDLTSFLVILEPFYFLSLCSLSAVLLPKTKVTHSHRIVSLPVQTNPDSTHPCHTGKRDHFEGYEWNGSTYLFLNDLSVGLH